MGSAYAKGLIQALIENGIDPSFFAFEADFAPFQPKAQKAVNDVNTFQYSHSQDYVAGNKKMPGALYMQTNKDMNQGHSISSFWGQVNTLPPGDYKVEDGEIMPF